MEVKSYEVVHEIFNLCSNNQMRDVFIEEIETDDPEKYIRSKHKDAKLEIEKEVLEDGSIRYVVMTTEIKQAYTFTLL